MLCSRELSCAIALIATLACPTETPMSCSILERRVWMPCVLALSCCASDCAADNTEDCAAFEPELADSACAAAVKLLKAFSSVPSSPGVP